MKKIIIISAVALFVLVSCQEKKELTVVGRWKANSIKINGSETVNTAPPNTNSIYDFKSDGNLKMYSDANPESSGGSSATYTANTTHIVVTDSSSITTYHIDAISTSELTLSNEYMGYNVVTSFDKQ